MADGVDGGGALDPAPTAPVFMSDRPARARISGIDAGRIVCAALVVLLHSLPPAASMRHPLSEVGMLCRVAVPFFFIASGYLLRQPITFGVETVGRPLRRLLPMYVFWFVVCYLAAWVWKGAQAPTLRDLVSGGAAFHLWFLPALGIAISAVSAGIALIGLRNTGALCIALAAYSICRSSYQDVLGIAGGPMRGGTMVAPLFVWIGAALARRPSLPGLRVSLLIAGLGWFGVWSEERLIATIGDVPMISHDFLVSTFAYGCGAFLVARSLPGGLTRYLAPLSPLALGIYLSHPLFLWPLQEVLPNDAPGTTLLQATLCFLGAALLAAGFLRVPYLRRLIS